MEPGAPPDKGGGIMRGHVPKGLEDPKNFQGDALNVDEGFVSQGSSNSHRLGGVLNTPRS